MSNTSVLSQGKEEKGDRIFWNEGPGALALGNPIIMDKISSFLGNRDLCHWYSSSHIFKDIIEQMDDSTWRRRTQKLAKALNMEIPPERTFREMFPIFKKEVDSLIKHIRGRCNSNLPDKLNLENITAAARLAHYGLIGFSYLTLCHVDLSTVPCEHLCSLASSVRTIFEIQTVRGCDLVKIIDSVRRSYKLGISNQNLDREATEAIVQAMETRIKFAEIAYYKMRWGNTELGGEDSKWMLDMEALTKYNGKGTCKGICLRADREDMYMYRQRLQAWAQDRNWSVKIDIEFGTEYMIGVERETEIPNSLIKNK